ncbi:MAG: hypothetical protein MK132_06695 [Lentisphaerales bacterium]|nr:hypothetical protein [Lentisphaerales bacterium]
MSCVVVKGIGAVIEITIGDWYAIIDSHGAHVLALFYKEENLLHYDREDISHSGIPLCLPHFGPLDNGEFVYEGKIYKMRQHGFIGDRELAVTEATADAVSYEFVADQVSKKIFPFEFILKVRFSLSQKGLKINLQVMNQSSVAMPLAPGVHPYFAVQDSQGIMMTTKASTANNFTNAYAIEKLAESGVFEVMEDQDHKLMKVLNEPNMNLIDHGLAKTEIFRKGQQKLELHADFKVFNRMTVWRNSVDAKFICVEPAYVKNGLNEQPILIAPGEIFETGLLISVG